jgi:hypothetical protein
MRRASSAAREARYHSDYSCLWWQDASGARRAPKHKIEHELQVNDGGHTWINWRLYLSELLPQLFR